MESLPQWGEEKCRDYFNRAVGYSKANGGRYLDWRQAVQNWERTDAKKGEHNETNNDGRSPRRKRLDEDARRLTELAEIVAAEDRALHPAHVPIRRPTSPDAGSHELVG